MTDWASIIENSTGYAELEEFVRPRLKEQLRRIFKQEFTAQNARIQRELNSRLAKLPENRRKYAERAIERIMVQLYGEREERILPIIGVFLDAMERDEYWEILKEIDRSSHSEVGLFAESLGHFGLVEMGLIGRQAQGRLRFLDYLDQLAGNPVTREKEMHTALQNNLWVFGADFSLISSNITLQRILQEQFGKKFSGAKASDRPDLLLLSQFGSRYVLIEFKRPNHTITREDQFQAEKYRDALNQFRPMDILLIGKSHEPALGTDRPAYIQLLSYSATINRARSELDWLLKELTDVRFSWASTTE